MLLSGSALGSILLLVATLLVAPADELADVYFKDGRVLRGRVTTTDTEVILQNPVGELRFDRNLVERIETLEPDENNVDAEYERRFQALPPDDVEGHFALAKWAGEQQRPDLAAKQCRLVLELAPEHDEARKLLESTTGKPDAPPASRAAADVGERPPPKPARFPAPPLLLPRDIQRLKLYEFPPDGSAGRARIKFLKKPGEPELDRLVLRDLGAHPEYGEAARNDYRRADAEGKLRSILDATGLKYADRIEITGDTAVFSTFRRKILPITLKSCTRSGCHGNKNAAVFRFPSGSRQTEAFAYTSFLLLDRLDTQYGPLINREKPEASVLLGFLLPRDGNTQPHPEVEGRRRFTAEFRDRRDRRHDEIVRWVGALRKPHPVYDLQYKFPAGMAAPRTRPGPTSRAAPEEHGEEKPPEEMKKEKP